jgi:hypothetical protein
MERMAGPPDQIPQRRWPDDERLVAPPAGGGEEKEQRVEMACTPERAGREYPHRFRELRRGPAPTCPALG